MKQQGDGFRSPAASYFKNLLSPRIVFTPKVFFEDSLVVTTDRKRMPGWQARAAGDTTRLFS